MTSAFDARTLRQCLGAYTTGVTVVTTLDAQAQPVGVTANSFTSVSLDPPLVLWCLRRQAWSFPLFEAAGRFVINILAADQIEVSRRFASPVENRFASITVTRGLGGLPLIDGCAAHLECTVDACHPGGDHGIFVGRVESVALTMRQPLVFSGGRYMRAVPCEAAPA